MRAFDLPPGQAGTLEIFGVRIRVLVPGAASGGAFSLFEEQTPPGAGPPLHVHHGQDEFFRVTEGLYRFRIGEAEIEAGPGHTLVVPRGTPHTFCNEGSTPGGLFMGFSPGGAEEFFERVAAKKLVVPADMESIARLGREYDLEFVGPNPFLA